MTLAEYRIKKFEEALKLARISKYKAITEVLCMRPNTYYDMRSGGWAPKFCYLIAIKRVTDVIEELYKCGALPSKDATERIIKCL